MEFVVPFFSAADVQNTFGKLLSVVLWVMLQCGKASRRPILGVKAGTADFADEIFVELFPNVAVSRSTTSYDGAMNLEIDQFCVLSRRPSRFSITNLPISMLPKMVLK